MIEFITALLPMSAQRALVKWAFRRVYALYQTAPSYGRLERWGIDDISYIKGGDFTITVDEAIL